MKVITHRTQIREVAEKWKAQYFRRDKWQPMSSGGTKGIYDALRALNTETATAADVAAIIGNCSWVKDLECSECRKTFPVIVEVGDEPDYESCTAWMCVGCLREAVRLAETESAQQE